MGQRKAKRKKLKEKKERTKKRVLARRKVTREQAKLEKEVERIKWQNREKLKPLGKIIVEPPE
tara:strand:+ start:29 stop:217 length:189 start_codon:yes stop_codon:yes gene_type:complete